MKLFLNVSEARLVGAGCILPDASWHMPIHVHRNEWEFIYFLQGCGRVETPGSTLHPQRYHMVVYPAGLPHAEWANPVDPEETIYMSIAVEANYLPGVHLIFPDRDGKLRWLASNILAEFQAVGLSPLVHVYSQALLLLVERLWAEGDRISQDHDFVDVVIQYINTHYAESLSMDRLAAVAHVSKTYLAHKFRQRTGKTLMRYVQEVRVEEAIRLLVTTRHSIGTVARMVGFADPLHFSRVFKRISGRTPSAMRTGAQATS
jgi:AraC-like DNA-binding protein